MDIEAKIESISYHPQMISPLKIYTLADFKSGKAFKRACFLLQYSDTQSFAVSRWTSPKRTRTYPYHRIYDTLNIDSRITIIPFVKDEGINGDHDYLQWDSVSLMSLLKVYVIPAYYKKAKTAPKKPGKITDQEFDYAYLLERLNALVSYNQSDAVHWNMNEVQQQIVLVAERAKACYARISSKTGVTLHAFKEFDAGVKDMKDDISNFRTYSRANAQAARERERITHHAKERTSGEKSILTIKNFIGGYYYWTVDESSVLGGKLLLTEKKNSKDSQLPALNDIKDALLKMVLFTNLTHVTADGNEYAPFPIVGLTSDVLQGYCHSTMDESEIEKFLTINEFKGHKRALVHHVFQESRVNHFFTYVASSKIETHQILAELPQ